MMKRLKILNLFSGIGGNRMQWGDSYEITAVEINQSIADFYKSKFPNDTVIIDDAYDYLEKHFTEFDIIWASPPCQSHSILSKARSGRAYNKTYTNDVIKIPDMRLYGLILFLQHHFRGNWVVENVKPFYKTIIPQTAKVGRHYIWSNIPIPNKKKAENKQHLNKWKEEAELKGFKAEELQEIKFDKRIDVIVHNCVVPSEGLYILKHLVNKKQKSLFEYG